MMVGKVLALSGVLALGATWGGWYWKDYSPVKEVAYLNACEVAQMKVDRARARLWDWRDRLEKRPTDDVRRAVREAERALKRAEWAAAKACR